MNNRKDYYKILGLQNNASQDDIKKAFRKLSKEYHPDRFVNETEEKRKEAEERFKDINEANQVLSDPQKKARYDGGGSFSFEDIFGNQNPFEGFGFNFDFGGFNPFGNQRPPQGPQPGANILHNVKLNLRQLYNGCEIKFKYNKNVRCEKCNGSGGEGIKTCPVCNGSGQIVNIQQHGPMRIQQASPCHHCHGTGKIVEKVCDSCNGNGLKSIEVEQTVNIRKWPQRGEQIIIKGAGSQSKDPLGPDGNLILRILWEVDSKYSLDDRNGNIYEQLSVPVFDVILGKEYKDLEAPNGEKINITIPPYSEGGTQITTNINGMWNKGNFIYIIIPEFPKELTEEQLELIKKIKGE